MSNDKILIEDRESRSFFGKIIKWIFIIFNILMLLWAVGGTSDVAQMDINDEYEAAGQAIGYAIGISIIFSMWAFGSVFLGIMVFFTRGKKRYIEKSE